MPKELTNNQQSECVKINKKLKKDREIFHLMENVIIHLDEIKVQIWCIHLLQTIQINNIIQQYSETKQDLKQLIVVLNILIIHNKLANFKCMTQIILKIYKKLSQDKFYLKNKNFQNQK